VAASGAAAQPSPGDKQTAEVLFDEGIALLKGGKLTEACQKLAESRALDPAMGTTYRLAECYEGTGRLVLAHELFTEVVAAAVRAGREDRAAQASARADAVLGRIPLLVIHVSPQVANLPGLELQRNETVLERAQWGQQALVDPGTATITARAPGKQPWRRQLSLAEGSGLTEVTVTSLDDTAVSPGRETASAGALRPLRPAREAGLSTQHIAALTTAGAGLAAVVAGSVLGGVAASQWSEAHGPEHCVAGDPRRCGAAGVALGQDAARSAELATATLFAGATALAAGGLLWLTAPPRGRPAAGLRLGPAITAAGAAVWLEGSL
jgi:hypothetical protein